MNSLNYINIFINKTIMLYVIPNYKSHSDVLTFCKRLCLAYVIFPPNEDWFCSGVTRLSDDVGY